MPSPYRLANLAGLVIGHSIVPAWSRLAGLANANSSQSGPLATSNTATISPATAIKIPAGVYSLRQLVLGLSPLLDVIVSRLGQDAPGDIPARSILIDGLAASLDTSSRESTLPLGKVAGGGVREELALQAGRIAKSIVRHVKDATPNTVTDNIALRSPCEGHLWTSETASLLLGPRSGPELMHLYNEWLHRLVLLRDALLPFENFDEVPLVIAADRRGIRDVEGPRKLFLVDILTGNIPNASIVDLAKVLTGRGLPRGGYGFQYAQGLVLPAFFSGSASNNLLRYHAAKVEEGQDLLFEYEHGSYTDAPRTEVLGHELGESLTAATLPTEASLSFEQGREPSGRVVKLRLTLGPGTCVAIDLGQAARGRRYAYAVQAQGDEAVKSHSLNNAVYHSAEELLQRPGLVASPRVVEGQQAKLHVVTVADDAVRLALLGKLYPENVVIMEEENVNFGAALHTGKGFTERFVLVGSSWK